MNIPQEVILDLLPLYASGDVSAVTRGIVDEYLRAHPEIATQLEGSVEVPLEATPLRAPDKLELETLERTRGRLRAQRWLFAFAWVFTALALTTRIDFGPAGMKVTPLLVENFRLFAVPAVLAILLWSLYFRRRTR